MADNTQTLTEFISTFKQNNSKKDLEQINNREQILQANIDTVNKLLDKFQGVSQADKAEFIKAFGATATPSYNLRAPVVHVWLNKVKIFPEITIKSSDTVTPELLEYVAQLRQYLDIHFDSFQLDMPFGGVSQTISGEISLFTRTPVEVLQFAVDALSLESVSEDPGLPIIDLQFGWTVTGENGAPKQLMSNILSFLVLDIQTSDFGNSQGCVLKFRIQDAGSAVLQNSSSDLAVLAGYPQEQLRTLLEGFLGIRLFTLDDLLYFNEIQEGTYSNIYKADYAAEQKRKSLIDKQTKSKEDVIAIASRYGVTLRLEDLDTTGYDGKTVQNHPAYVKIYTGIYEYIMARRVGGTLYEKIESDYLIDRNKIVAQQETLYNVLNTQFNEYNTSDNLEFRQLWAVIRVKYPDKSPLEAFVALNLTEESKKWNSLEAASSQLDQAEKAKKIELASQAKIAQNKDLADIQRYFNVTGGTSTSLGNLQYDISTVNATESDSLSKTFFISSEGPALRLNSNTLETAIASLLDFIKCRWYPVYNVNLKEEISKSQEVPEALEEFRRQWKAAASEKQRAEIENSFKREYIKVAQNCKLIYVPGIDPTIKTSGSDVYFKSFQPEAGAYFLLPEEFLDISIDASELPLIYGPGGSNVPYFYAGGQNLLQSLKTKTEFYGEVSSVSTSYNSLIATMRACVNEDMGSIVSGARLAAKNSASLRSENDRAATKESLQRHLQTVDLDKLKQEKAQQIESFRSGSKFRAVRQRFQKTIGAKRLIYGDDPSLSLAGVDRSYRNSYSPAEEAKIHLRKRVSMFLNYPQTISMVVPGDPFLLRQGIGAFELINYYLDIATNNLKFNYMLSGTYLPQKISHSIRAGEYTTTISAMKISPSSKGVLKEFVVSTQANPGEIVGESNDALAEALLVDVTKLQTAKLQSKDAYDTLLTTYNISTLQTVADKLDSISNDGN